MSHLPETSLVMRREQRKHFRFPVEGEAMLFAEQTSSYMRCHMLDLGLEGCRLRRVDDFPVQLGMSIEVAFRIAGAMFRFPGTVQWSAKNSILGLHFTKMSEQRKQELADLLGGMREELEARELEARENEKQAAKEKQAEHAEPQPEQAEPASALHLVSANGSTHNGNQNGSQHAGHETGPEAAKDQSARKRERREHGRYTLDSHARILFLSIHTRLVGKVLDLSMGGCRIRSQQRIPVGAFRRVEVEFIVDGLPLLLPGVTQSVHDKYTIGIRFVEMTDRKRGQLKTVIDEIEERNAAAAAESAAADQAEEQAEDQAAHQPVEQTAEQDPEPIAEPVAEQA